MNHGRTGALSVISNWQLVMALVLTSHTALAGVRRIAFVVVPANEETEREALELQRSTAALLAQDARFELVDLSALCAPADAVRAAQQLERVTARAL